MEVLLAYPDSNVIDNPFVYTLKEGLKTQGCSVHWGLNQFWGNYMNYNIIHINWPNSLFENWNPTTVEILYLEKILEDIKKRGIKIVYTRHNAQPHYSSNINILKCYKLVEENADAIVHLGYSDLKEVRESEEKKHFVIPHHIYDIYDTDITKEDARKELNISKGKFVILTFGAYRDKEEVELVLKAYKRLKVKNKYLLAPRLGEPLGLNIVYQGIGRKRLQKQIERFKLKLQNIQIADGFISDKELPFYFKAADAVLIQRKDILNSGNLPLAYLFSRVVVGPDCGNIKEILEETDNVVFNPDIENSLVNSLNEVYLLDKNTLENRNYEYASNNWNINSIAKQYMEVYSEIIR